MLCIWKCFLICSPESTNEPVHTGMAKLGGTHAQVLFIGGSDDTFLSDCVMLLTQLMKVCGFFFNVDCKITLTFNTTYFSKTFHYLLQHVAVSILNMMKLKIFIKIFQMLNLSNLWLFMCWSMLLSPKFINSFTNKMYPYYFITKYYVP